MTLAFAILGWPVAHSRSPLMHRAAFRALGLDARYVPRPVPPGTLAQAVDEVRANFDGANVTVPHKSAVMSLLDEVEPVARAIGAVNTLVRTGKRWVGTNTDAAGLLRSLEEAEIAVPGMRAVVLGAGGAARASVYALTRAGAEVVVAARRAAAARALTGDLGGRPLSLAEVEGPFRDADLVVQATSAPLGDDARAFAEALPLAALPNHATVVDLVYAPRETTVLRAAKARGLRTIDGTGMLLHQGALAFTRWTGQPAPIEAMRAALLASLEPSRL